MAVQWQRSLAKLAAWMLKPLVWLYYNCARLKLRCMTRLSLTIAMSSSILFSTKPAVTRAQHIPAKATQNFVWPTKPEVKPDNSISTVVALNLCKGWEESVAMQEAIYLWVGTVESEYSKHPIRMVCERFCVLILRTVFDKSQAILNRQVGSTAVSLATGGEKGFPREMTWVLF